MAILLSLETSTGVCSAALHDDGKLMASSSLHVEQSASAQLAVMIQDLLKWCGIPAAQLKGVGVSAGPGSYTGLRIGTATAKGLCFALNIPLYSVNTLELMTRQVIASLPAAEDFLLCPMLDARRMEVYCLVSDRSGAVLEPTQAKVIDETSFASWLERGKILFFGNGAAKCRDVLQHPNAFFLTGIVPAAEAMGEMMYTLYKEGREEVLPSFEPLYLKDFVVKKPKVQV